MKTVTFSVADREAVKRRTLEALSGKRRGAHISFASADLLWKVLTAKRWELLKALAAGVLRRNADGKIEFPFDAVHVDFMLKAAQPFRLRGDLCERARSREFLAA